MRASTFCQSLTASSHFLGMAEIDDMLVRTKDVGKGTELVLCRERVLLDCFVVQNNFP